YVRARKGIGYLPQEPSIFRGLTVEQNILAILETMDLDAMARRARLRELLAELNLTPLAQSPAHTLSGGERRRAEITRALGVQPKLHTKLVQKLILTPSLQQAIKLLPMSTLELSDLLNQEMVENPMLEEVPTEELQPADAAAAAEKPEPEQQANKTDTWDDQDYEYFFGDYLDDGYR